MYKRILCIIITTLAFLASSAQTDWKLKAEKDGIKVYTKLPPGSKLKAIKIECTVQASLSQLVFAIMDINSCKEWVYNTKTCTIIKQVSESELYYYSEINVPWPVSNRDFVAHLTVSQNAVSKAVTVDAENVPGLVAQKENTVRIMQSVGKWVITPVNASLLKIDYTLFADPGGSVPAWLINMFITKGPLESFKKLKEQVKKTVYKNLHVPYIKD